MFCLLLHSSWRAKGTSLRPRASAVCSTRSRCKSRAGWRTGSGCLSTRSAFVARRHEGAPESVSTRLYCFTTAMYCCRSTLTWACRSRAPHCNWTLDRARTPCCADWAREPICSCHSSAQRREDGSCLLRIGSLAHPQSKGRCNHQSSRKTSHPFCLSLFNMISLADLFDLQFKLLWQPMHRIKMLQEQFNC